MFAHRIAVAIDKSEHERLSLQLCLGILGDDPTVKTFFLKPRLEGGRFDEHSVPLEVLKDWAVFEELVLEVARHLYLKEHPERQRVPRGFAESFSLHLTSVEKGSALPVIDQVSPEGASRNFRTTFEHSRDLVLATIASASTGQALPTEFPPDLLGYFDQFGKSLREGEAVEFTVNDRSKPIIYDRSTRKKLVLNTANEYRSTADLRGWISEVNVEKRTYTLKLVSGERIQAGFAPELRKTVVAALDQFEKSKVLVKAVAVFDRSDRPKKIEQTTHVEILDPNDVPARLEELALLKNGWMDGLGIAPVPEGIRWLSAMWPKSYPDDLPDPFAYPTVEGGVQLEWTLADWELSAEVNLSNHKALLTGVKVGANQDFDEEADLNFPAGWEAVERMVRSHLIA